MWAPRWCGFRAGRGGWRCGSTWTRLLTCPMRFRSLSSRWWGVVDVPVVQIVGLCAPVVEQIVVLPMPQIMKVFVGTLAVEQLGVDVFFFGVKGVFDVLAGRWSWVLTCSLQLSRASVTCLLGFEQCVEEFFAVVKSVFDVLARRWSWVLTCSFLVSRASLTCLLGVKQGFVDFFAVSRASVTCLLG